MSIYLALAAISVLAGFGLLTRLRLPVSPIHLWYLAPGATMLVWAIALGVGVSLGLTLRTLSGPVLALTLVVAILGALDARRAWAAAKPTGLLILAAIPLAVMAMDVAAGLSHYIGGPAQDGWSYVAYGQYLWEWPKGTEGGLAPLHQFAAYLSRARFIASAMLALFSPLTGAGGDTQAAAGAFVAWTLFVFGASCAASADGLGIRRGWLVLFTAIAVMSPWVYSAVQIHNYDNLLALSFLPFAMSVVAAAERPGTSVTVLLGAVVAATVYSYPEMSPFVGFGLVLAVACRATRDRLWLAWGKTCVLAGALAAFLLIPGRADLARFISIQLDLATRAAGTRPGEGIFPYLLDFANWPTAFWGFGFQSEPSTTLAIATRYVISAALWILAVVGIVSLVRRRRWDVVLLGLGLSAGAVVLVASAALRLWGLQAPALGKLGDGRRGDRWRGGHRGARRRERGRTRRAPRPSRGGRPDRDRVLRQFRPAPTRLSPAPRSTDGRAVSGAHRGRGSDRIRTDPGCCRQLRCERLGRVLPPPSRDPPARLPGLHGASRNPAVYEPRCARRDHRGLVRPERRRTR